MPASPTCDGPRVNDEIRAQQVRLIDQDGEMQGATTARDAWLRAQVLVGLDLLEISPNADPPVVKILDILRQIQIRTAEEAERGQEKAEGHRDQGDQGPPEYR